VQLLGPGPQAIVYNEHITHDGPTVLEHACRLGLEGIVSKRLDGPYRSGASKAWLKSKNPLSEGVRRERGEDCVEISGRRLHNRWPAVVEVGGHGQGPWL
jgi:ATP-dependent DNA ligase